MLLKLELYAQTEAHTLAENIDKAWKIYNEKSTSPQAKAIAHQFLIYALDIPYLIKNHDRFKFLRGTSIDVEQTIASCMRARAERRLRNPEWIPGCTPQFLELDNETTDLHLFPATPAKKEQSRKLIKSMELLKVSEESKKSDEESHTRLLNNHERAKYRVHIYEGRFYQGGELFTTCGHWFRQKPYKSHSKLKYGSFTFNLNGELSVFNHLWGVDKVKHSSMNSGNLVVCAGELKIADGKLVAINTFSGHYQPTLFNIYLLLDYFSEKGVDISGTKIYLQDEAFRDLGFDIASRVVYLDGKNAPPFYEISASSFIINFKGQFVGLLEKIQKDMINIQRTSLTTRLFMQKDKWFNTSLTQERMKAANNVYITANCALTMIEEGRPISSVLLIEVIDCLKKLKEENAFLSQQHNKKSENGRLQHKIESYIKQVNKLCERAKPREEIQPLMPYIF